MAIDAGVIQGFLDLDILGFVDKLEEASKTANEKLETIEKTSDSKAAKIASGFNKVGKALTVGITTPIIGAGAVAIKTTMQWESASSKLQSTLGLTTEETETFTNVARNVYKNGFGESFDAITENLQTIGQTIRGLNDEDLMYVTTGVTNLADTMDMDAGESVRGVKALMQGFGLTAQEAMDMLAAGAQNGLNYSDELGDNLAEYGPRFSQMGFSASQYFQILKNGTENGAYNLDKCNDFLNEFQTALSDGRIDENIGSFSEGTQDLFNRWKNGEATMAEVYTSLMQDFAGMEDGYKKNQIASDIWSSLGEDNAMSMINAMQPVGDTFDNVAGKSQEMADAASENLASKWTSVVRTFQDGLGRIGESAEGPLSQLVDKLQQLGNWFDTLSPEAQQTVILIAGIVAAIGPLLLVIAKVITAVSTIVAAIGPVVAAITTAFSAIAGAIKLVIAFLTGPVGIAIAIAAVVAAIVAFVATHEEARQKIVEVWNAICEFLLNVLGTIGGACVIAWDTICNAVSSAVDTVSSTIESVFNAIVSFFSNVWRNITTIVSTTWENIKSTVSNAVNSVKSTIENIFNSIKSTISNVWNTAKSITTTAWDNMKSAVSNGINGVVNFVRNLPSKIVNALGNVGSLLWNAGSSIINGLLRGIKSAIGGVYSFVSGIAGKIASLKGPEKKDRKLLVPNGGWIVSGLDEGLEESFEDTEDKVSGFASRLQDAFGKTKSKLDMAFTAAKDAIVPELNVTEAVNASGLIDYDLLSAKLADVLKGAPINPQVDVQMGEGNVYLDNERVGRSVAPVVSRVMTRKVGVANA